MLRITEAERYAMLAMVYIASFPKGTLVTRKDVADNADKDKKIPSAYFAKIAQYLARVGIIEIRQGSKGGFIMEENAEDISLEDIIVAVSGQINIGAMFDENSPLGKAIQRVNDDLADDLDAITMDMLV
jgi:Rrf2 family protein